MQIFVKGFAGRHYTIEVESSDTVDSLKAKVEELEGVPAKQQRLLIGGRQLEDGHILSKYKVKEFATVHLVLRLLNCRRCPFCTDRYVYVQTRTTNTIALQVEPSDTITDVRKKISGHQSLFLAGNKLEDDRTFGYYYQIQNDATLHLDFGTQIFVKMLNGKTITLEVDPSDTVGDVKAKILDQQRIIFDGSRLDGQHKLGFYKIQNHSTLHLDLCPRGSMQIAVKTHPLPGSEAIRFKVQFTDKIGDLKAKIQDQQRLLFKGQQLVDGQMLADYNAQKESTLHLDCPMQVFVKTSTTGQTITLEVEPSNTIDNVKEKISGHQSLIFYGTELDDGKTLAECNVHMGSTLHLDA
jgi:ubiquitin